MPEPLEGVPVRRRRQSGRPLRDRRRLCRMPVVPRQAQLESGVRIEHRVLGDQRRDFVGVDRGRPSEPGFRAGRLRHCALGSLDLELLLKPVDLEDDPMFDATTGDRRDRFVTAEPEGQGHDHLDGVPLDAAIGRRVGLARGCALGPNA